MFLRLLWESLGSAESYKSKYWIYLMPHEKRGYLAMQSMGVMLRFKGILCHDHWKTYCRFILCLHALCNAHHIRELTDIYEDDILRLMLDIDVPFTNNQGENDLPRTIRIRQVSGIF